MIYSAGEGQAALDRLSEADADPNSVFTRTLIPLLRADLPLKFHPGTRFNYGLSTDICGGAVILVISRCAWAFLGGRRAAGG